MRMKAMVNHHEKVALKSKGGHTKKLKKIVEDMNLTISKTQMKK